MWISNYSLYGYSPCDVVQLYTTKHEEYTSSRGKVTNQKLDYFCLNESKTRRFSFEMVYSLCLYCTTSQGEYLYNESLLICLSFVFSVSFSHFLTRTSCIYNEGKAWTGLSTKVICDREKGRKK